MNNNEKQLINEVEDLHYQLMKLRNSKQFILGNKLIKIKFINKLFELKKKKDNKKYIIDLSNNSNIIKRNTYNNINNKKIVIYTCVTGNYDYINEPEFLNEKIDYVLYTNNKDIKSNKWKVIYIDDKNIDNISLNRYYKMNPFEILKEYDYSIYIDGKVKIYSDLSSYIDRISKKNGIAFYKHSYRNKISSELKTCRNLKKGNTYELVKQVEKFRKDGLPDDYGLVDACIIATDLKSSVAKKILSDWWKEFNNSNSKRDQIAISYILYKNNIKINEIATLGNNVLSDPKIEIVEHKNLIK